MSYSQLYKYCQGLQGRIGRRQLFPKVAELTRLPKPKQMITDKLDPDVILGFIVFPDGVGTRLHTFSRGRPLIMVARGIDEDWRRFVMIKELMHYFDQALERVSSADEFEGLVSEISAPLPERSAAVNSEAKALWMAFGVICTEEKRQDYQRRRESGEITDAQIAKELGMPVSMVAHLFDPNFKSIITSLLSDG
jgi:Zn-dependent peptidase ImmA (M78 family)